MIPNAISVELGNQQRIVSSFDSEVVQTNVGGLVLGRPEFNACCGVPGIFLCLQGGEFCKRIHATPNAVTAL
ncbi:MAG: hypothetical protein V1798_05105 [Pseudomonadota bacterium]